MDYVFLSERFRNALGRKKPSQRPRSSITIRPWRFVVDWYFAQQFAILLNHHSVSFSQQLIARIENGTCSTERRAAFVQSLKISIALESPKIRFFLLQNRQGKTRLSKWYTPPTVANNIGTTPELEKVRMEAEVHRLVTARDKKYTNFIEYNNYKLIYRRYAGLFFTIAVDVNDNELSYLETIHLFVELLDSYFNNVCELDIVFHFNKVYSILDEFMLAGEIEETSKREILDRVKLLDKME